MAASELHVIADDVRRKAEELGDEAARVVRKGALNVKNGWRENAKDIQNTPTTIPGFPRSITFEEYPIKDGLHAVVAPNTGPQAKLGLILEFGGARVKSPPYNLGGRALRDEIPRFMREMYRIAGLD